MFPVKSVKNLKKNSQFFAQAHRGGGSRPSAVGGLQRLRRGAARLGLRGPGPQGGTKTQENLRRPKDMAFLMFVFFRNFQGKKHIQKIQEFRNETEMICLRYRASKHCQESVECVNLHIAILEVLKTGERVAVKARVGASSAHGI